MKHSIDKVAEQITVNNEIKKLLEQKMQLICESNRLQKKIDSIDKKIDELRRK
mgnify:CR=1 FL=1